MKALQIKQQANKKLGKRTYTLKELAQRDFAIAPGTSAKETTPKFNLVNIQEDLLDAQEAAPLKEAPIGESNKASKDQQSTPGIGQQNLALAIVLFNQLIAKEIDKTADVLELSSDEL